MNQKMNQPNILNLYIKLSGSQHVKYCSVTEQLYAWNGIDTLQVFNSVGVCCQILHLDRLTAIFQEHCFTMEHTFQALRAINLHIDIAAKDHKQWLSDMEDESQILDTDIEDVLDQMFGLPEIQA
tara:strand:+ start:1376 stop:1750 length:375 start_codon:yes stop_codon:yes gene_type:complete